MFPAANENQNDNSQAILEKDRFTLAAA